MKKQKRASAVNETEESPEKSVEDNVCIHIFSVSATLVGVCLTVIGIFRAINELKPFDSLGDNILAFNALIFLTSCIVAYTALRSRYLRRKRRLEKIADFIFIGGLTLMVAVCSLIAYTFI